MLELDKFDKKQIDKIVEKYEKEYDKRIKRDGHWYRVLPSGKLQLALDKEQVALDYIRLLKENTYLEKEHTYINYERWLDITKRKTQYNIKKKKAIEEILKKVSSKLQYD